MSFLPHPEYPRPEFVRKEWLNLNGEWEFEFDDDEQGLAEMWYRPGHHLHGRITVPFPFEAPASGIGDPTVHKVVWYRCEFEAPESWQGRRVRLNFGAVDYEAKVWLNGLPLTAHRGGYTPFSCDMTWLLKPGRNVLTVRVFDDVTPEQPRGKQTSTHSPHRIWYTRCTGIWRTVWIEPVSEYNIAEWQVEPDFENETARLTLRTGLPESGEVAVTVECEGAAAASGAFAVSGGRGHITLPLRPFRTWSPDRPLLYDLHLALSRDDVVTDSVTGYFGVRSVSTSGGRILLNGRPCYQKLVLDQAYWPEGVYTPPDDDAVRRDVEWVRQLGFNGVRKHQVSADPRFLYWADRLGLLVWADMPGQTLSRADAPRVGPRGAAEGNYLSEYVELIESQRNHPCVIAWVPFNESWGIYDVAKDLTTQRFVYRVVRLTRMLDPTRLVIDNDGWEHIGDTDVYAVHNYAYDGESLTQFLSGCRETGAVTPLGTTLVAPGTPPPAKALMSPGERYGGYPVVLSEYGGIAFFPAETDPTGDRWGYGDVEPDAAAMLRRYRSLQEAIAAAPELAGYCYTQLTDVEQEVNGLLTFDRRPKVDPDCIRELNEMVR